MELSGMSPNQRSKFYRVSWRNLCFVVDCVWSKARISHMIVYSLVVQFRFVYFFTFKWMTWFLWKLIRLLLFSSISESPELFQWNILLYHFLMHPFLVHYTMFLYRYSLNLNKKMVHIFLSKFGNTHWQPNCK